MEPGGQQINERRWIGASVSKTKMGTGGEDWTPVAGTNENKETCAGGGQGRQFPGVLMERRGHWWLG